MKKTFLILLFVLCSLPSCKQYSDRICEDRTTCSSEAFDKFTEKLKIEEYHCIKYGKNFPIMYCTIIYHERLYNVVCKEICRIDV